MRNSTEEEKRPLLKVSNLCVSFSKRRGTFGRERVEIRAVDDVSFDVFESEIVSVVGESGSGKTTIARCVLGLVKPTSGTIDFNGRRVSSLPSSSLREYWRDVQLIFQDPFESLNPRLNVYTIISLPIRRLTSEQEPSKVREKVVQLLREVDLDPGEVINKFSHQLSGGQRQRVNIARALASNPKLLIADEPITMLDASQRLNILSLLMKLKAKRSFTIILITHDLASAKMMSDRIIVMYLGRIVEAGPKRSVFSTPHHPYTEMILSATPQLKKDTKFRNEDYSSSAEIVDVIAKGCVFRPRCKYATKICGEVSPELLEKSEGQVAACHNPLNVER
jgi:oligopeptide/dipeptide ABC transporter ATP-binding protein